jgi:hypothetical protein
MSQPRYFLPDHPALTEVYSKADLRAMLQSGELSRSDIVVDDETGLSHLLGDLLAAPYPDVTTSPVQSTSGSRPRPPLKHEFRADTPLPKPPEYDPGKDDVDDEEEWPDEDLEEILDGAEDDAEDDPRESLHTHRQRSGHRPSIFDDEDEPEDAFLESRLPPPPAVPLTAQVEPAGPMLPARGGEEILFLGHPSWFAYPKSLLATLAGAVGSAVSLQQNFGLEWVVLLGSISALILVFISLDRTTTTYFITTRRVEMEFGLVGRNSKEVRVADIRAIDVQQKSYAALVGIGNVDFDSSASPGAEVRFKDVSRPHEIKQLVRQLQG